MGFKEWLHKKTAPKTQGVLTDSDRAAALAERRAKHAIKQQEKYLELLDRITKMETKTNPQESVVDSLLKQAIPILLAKMRNETGNQTSLSVYDTISNQTAAPGLPHPGISAVKAVNYSKEQIQDILKANPKLKRNAHHFTDDQIKEYIINQMPNISQDSIKIIIEELRT